MLADVLGATAALPEADGIGEADDIAELAGGALLDAFAPLLALADVTTALGAGTGGTPAAREAGSSRGAPTMVHGFFSWTTTPSATPPTAETKMAKAVTIFELMRFAAASFEVLRSSSDSQELSQKTAEPRRFVRLSIEATPD